MKGRPLALFCVCWIMGSSAAYLYNGWSLIWILLGVLLLLGMFLYLQRIQGVYSLVLLLAVLVSSCYMEWTEIRNVSKLPMALNVIPAEIVGMSVEVEGTIASKVKVDGDRAQFVLSLQGVRPLGSGDEEVEDTFSEINEKVQVQIKLLEEGEQETAEGWKRGDQIQFTGTLEIPGTARNFGSFDYGQYLQRLHIHWLLKGKGAEGIAHQPLETWFSKYIVLRLSDSARKELGSQMEFMFEEPHAGYMKGLVIGIGDEIDPDTYGDFSKLGLTHILAISGMHVAIYVSGLLLLLSVLRLSKETALVVTFLLIPFYVLLSGSSPSVVRAGIMSMMGLYMTRQGLMKDGLNILCLTALLMLWMDPYMLVNVSFQLSFLVTAGLMIFVPLLQPHFHSWPKWLSGTAVITIAAQLLSFPMTVFYFNQFSLLSFGANFLLVSFISFLILPLGALVLLLVYIWEPAVKPIVWVVSWLNQRTFDFVTWLNTFDQFVLIWAKPHFIIVLSYYLLLYYLLRLLKEWKISKQPLPLSSEDTVPLTPLLQSVQPGEKRMSHTFSFANGFVPVLNNEKKHGLLSGGTRLQQVFQAVQISSAWPELDSLFSVQGAGYYAREPFTFLKRIMVIILFIVLLAGLSISYQGPYRKGEGTVAFIDVGQGDSMLITTPTGKHILVDGGGTIQFGQQASWKQRRDPYEVGKSLLVPLLKKRGVHKLDAVILSHADQDHAGGLQAVFENIPVSKFISNGTITEKPFYQELIQTVLEQKVTMYEVSDGMEYRPDAETTLSFIAPEENVLHTSPDDTGEISALPVLEEQNHVSVVFLMEMEEVSFLFTGDVDSAAELDILDRIKNSADKNQSNNGKMVPIDVLKVAHHGSKSSTTEEWLNYFQPRLSVISAGVNNTYGHPHPIVTERLQDHGSEIFRTDTMGEIQIRVRDGEIQTRRILGSEK
ncbi:ComEC/Rec2 family competence protein [Paenibacillus gallinarum]|uniref:ComEC/Rec2 family competence protein n=1 Tax=Paenibacillus gallinarum TaxID=2762232 RepID=A0ABR8SVQ8_9BACL|nr:ComEC/Rec2 family competence protein [Paenibacillus gallinarum]MBD7967542.1 ComEC/Rec2 family competence protein [Paenibacillus gallinarum]